MKKLLIAFVAGVGLFCGSAKAQTTPVQIIGGTNSSASSRTVQGMVGIEINGVGLALNDNAKDFAEDAFSTFTASAGVKFPKVSEKFGIGISAFYQKSSKEDKSSNVYNLISGRYGQLDTTLGYEAYGADVSLYIPVSKQIDITGNIGIGYYDFKLTGTESYVSDVYFLDFHEKHYGLRLGAGVEFKVIENLAFTGNVRYVGFDYDDDEDGIKGLAEFGIGLKLYF